MPTWDEILTLENQYVSGLQTDAQQARAALAATQAMIAEQVARIAQDDKDKAALQAAFDAFKAADTTEDAAYEAEIAKLKAQINVLQPVEYKEIANFPAANGTAGFYFPTGYTGKGIDKTIFRILPNTSTHKAAVDALTTGQTNQLRVLKAGGQSATNPLPANVVLRDFTVQATDQGHPYNGLMVMWSDHALIERVKVHGMVGFSSGPPGETFSVQGWHSDSLTTNDVIADGRDPVTGVPVASTLFSHNGQLPKGATHNRAIMQYSPYGFGTAMFQDSGHFVYNECQFLHLRKGINIEDSNAATYDFDRCNFLDVNGGGYVAQISSKSFGPVPVVVNFRDCKVDGDGVLRVRTYPNATQQAKDSDIHCFIGGKEVTNDPTKFQIVHTA